MTILHPLDDFLYQLFPNAIKTADHSTLIEEIGKFYSVGAFKPMIFVEDGFVRVEIDTQNISVEEKEFQKALNFCEKRRYNEAKGILARLIRQNPAISEYHRVMGQILSDEGNQEEAINCLIDALKWDPKNDYALIMMGNIFSRNLNDTKTALEYYHEVIKRNPQNALAYNNIGSAMLQKGNLNEGIDYLEKAYELDKSYPNTTYGLALAYEMKGESRQAFHWACECMKASSTSNKQLYALSMEVVKKAIRDIVKDDDGTAVFNEYKNFLEKKCGLPIIETEDNRIPTAAKLEIAENYGRDYHEIRYKDAYPMVNHLKMHELVHLDFITEAREKDNNKLFISTGEFKAKFIRDFEPTFNKLGKSGISEDKISNYINSLFEGINRQIFNAPIDLFIEDFLFENYPELRPMQFSSVLTLLMEGQAAVTNNDAKKFVPDPVFKASKILNIINALHFKDLFGLDMVQDLKPTQFELKQAKELFEEFQEYRKDREPAEEYELVEHWGKDLEMDGYFEMVFETDYRDRAQDLDEFMESLEEDPLGINSDKKYKEEQTKTFLENQEKIGTNMAVVMFMVDALQFFENKSKGEIKKIAMDIALLGTQGFHPDKSGYSVPSISGKTFSGYHMLAYYYVSWKLAIPEMVDQLQLPFNEEYKLAKTLHKPGK